MEIRLHKKTLIHDTPSYHIKHDRLSRYKKAISKVSNENATLCDTFEVDKGHTNGIELHNIYSNKVIKIYNKDTYKLITIFVARNAQIKRYYEAINQEINSKINF